jgi:hypothetical protein
MGQSLPKRDVRATSAFHPIATTVARIWAGIHSRSADARGIELGHAIADNALKTQMLSAAR